MTRWEAWLLAGLAVLVVGGWLYNNERDRPHDTAAPTRPTARAVSQPAGWQNISECTEFKSFGGDKSLSLERDRAALASGVGKDKTNTVGTWAYDEASSRYTLTFDGNTRSYNLVAPEESGVCLLISGSVAAANLEASWFARVESEPDYPYDDMDRY